MNDNRTNNQNNDEPKWAQDNQQRGRRFKVVSSNIIKEIEANQRTTAR